MHAIAMTAGEPAGIGPDITLQLAAQPLPALPIVIGDPELLRERAEQLDLSITIRVLANPALLPNEHEIGSLWVHPIPTNTTVVAGELNSKNAPYVLQTLRTAVEGCLSQRYRAMVTAPVHKGVINDAGIPFRGHTELLGQLTQAQPVMLLLTESGAHGQPLRVALATTHLPLNAVSNAINKTDLQRILRILAQDLHSRFRIEQPCIAVAGLNPHAGEHGHLGREEIEIIQPALDELRQQEHLQLLGPLAADTLFTPRILNQCDAVLAMYHDQGLPVLKYAGFGQAVNVTLGLPIIRTSVDHGTALSLAGTGKAEVSSLLAAFKLAARISSQAGHQP